MAEYDRELLESQPFPLKDHSTNLLKLTPSEFQYWGSSWKGTYMGGTELSGVRTRARVAAFSQTEVLAEVIHFSFSEPYPQRAGKQEPYLSLHQLANTVHSALLILRQHPNQLLVPSKPFPVAFT